MISVYNLILSQLERRPQKKMEDNLKKERKIEDKLKQKMKTTLKKKKKEKREDYLNPPRKWRRLNKK
jgi:hypothetical protein